MKAHKSFKNDVKLWTITTFIFVFPFKVKDHLFITNIMNFLTYLLKIDINFGENSFYYYIIAPPIKKHTSYILFQNRAKLDLDDFV